MKTVAIACRIASMPSAKRQKYRERCAKNAHLTYTHYHGHDLTKVPSERSAVHICFHQRAKSIFVPSSKRTAARTEKQVAYIIKMCLQQQQHCGCVENERRSSAPWFFHFCPPICCARGHVHEAQSLRTPILGKWTSEAHNRPNSPRRAPCQANWERFYWN